MNTSHAPHIADGLAAIVPDNRPAFSPSMVVDAALPE